MLYIHSCIASPIALVSALSVRAPKGECIDYFTVSVKHYCEKVLLVMALPLWTGFSVEGDVHIVDVLPIQPAKQCS